MKKVKILQNKIKLYFLRQALKKIYIINLNIFKMENYNSNVVESDKSPNMHYDLLYKSNFFIKMKYIYYYSNTCG